jgi:threonine/homoserine/homoserine lactone efflux protein
VYGGLAVIADRAHAWLQHKPRAGALAARSVGMLLIAAALVTGVGGWRAM